MEKDNARTGAMTQASPVDGDRGNAGDILRVLEDLRDVQRQTLDHQSRFLWIMVPIFALLCVQIVLELVR